MLVVPSMIPADIFAKGMRVMYHARRMEGHTQRRNAVRSGSYDVWQRRCDERGRLTTTLPSALQTTVVVTNSICIALGWMVLRIVLDAMVCPGNLGIFHYPGFVMERRNVDPENRE